MSTTSGLVPLAADKKIKEEFVAGVKGYLPQYQRVFIIETPERRNEAFSILKTNSAVTQVQDGGAYPQQDIKELGANYIAVNVFKSAIAMSDLTEVFAEKNYGKVSEAAKTRGYHFTQKTDVLCADILNNGTSTSAPYGINIAGTTYAQFSTTSPIGDSGATQSNRQSGNLDKTTLNSARVLMRKMKDHDGMVANYQVRRLVVPVEETMNAMQLCFSAGEPESANRNDNYLKTLGLEVIEWPQLTSTSACFLLAAKDDFGTKGLRLEVAELPSVRRILSQVTGNWNWQWRMILAPGVIDYLGAVSIGL